MIDEEIVVSLIDQGLNSKEIAEELAASLKEVNALIIDINNKKRSVPAQIGHLKKSIRDKEEESERLTEHRDVLAENAQALWGMIGLLQKRAEPGTLLTKWNYSA